MAEIHARHWRYRQRRWSLRAAVIFSAIVHIALFSLALLNWGAAQPKAIPISFDMSFVSPPTPNPTPEAKPTKAPPPPPKKVEPEPKKEEPKKEPPKPEPKKEPVKVAEKKPEPKKEKPKPEKKPEPKKEPPKKEPDKKKPEPKKAEPQAITPQDTPAPEVVAKQPPPSAGVQQQQLPPLLNMWGRQVQRKVEGQWAPPAGIQLTPDNHEVQITFWVGRDGNLLSQPTADKAADSALVQSCIQAIVGAQPLPPLPLEFVGERQQVVYVFSLVNALAAGGGTG